VAQACVTAGRETEIEISRSNCKKEAPCYGSFFFVYILVKYAASRMELMEPFWLFLIPLGGTSIHAMKKICGLFFLVFLLTSCSKVKWSNVTVNDKYALQLPSYLKPASFSKDASLQVQNSEKEFYLMLVDEDKAQFVQYGLDYDLHTYFKVAANKYDSSGTVHPTLFLLGKDSACQADFKGNINGNDVLFKVVTIETKSSFYKLIIWMMLRDKETHAPDVERIIHSFHEIQTH